MRWAVSGCVARATCLALVYCLWLDQRPLIVCLQQCEFTESRRKNKANTKLFRHNGERLNALSTFSFFFNPLFGYLASLFVLLCILKKNKHLKNTTLLKDTLYLVKYERRGASQRVFNLSCLTVGLFIRLCTTSAFHTCLYLGRKPISFASKKEYMHIYIYLYIQSVTSCILLFLRYVVILKYFFPGHVQKREMICKYDSVKHFQLASWIFHQR